MADTRRMRGEQYRGRCALMEERARSTAACVLLNGERQVGEGSGEPVVRVEVNGQFVVAAAQTWHVR